MKLRVDKQLQDDIERAEELIRNRRGVSYNAITVLISAEVLISKILFKFSTQMATGILEALLGLNKAPHSPVRNAPPGAFVFLLACVAKPGRAEELLGDAEAEFHQMEVRLGRRRARWWYRVHVVSVVVRMVPSYIWRIFVVKRLLGL